MESGKPWFHNLQETGGLDSSKQKIHKSKTTASSPRIKKHTLLNQKSPRTIEDKKMTPDEEPDEKVENCLISPIKADETSPKTKKEPISGSGSGSGAATGLLKKFRNLQISTKHPLTARGNVSDANGLGDIEEESEG